MLAGQSVAAPAGWQEGAKAVQLAYSSVIPRDWAAL